MWKLGFLAIGIAVGAVLMSASGTEAEDGESKYVLGAFPSHHLQEDFDMSVGVTVQGVPLKAEKFRMGREQINVPDHYGELVGVTGDSHTSILWFQAGTEIRNVVVGRPDRNLFVLELVPSKRYEDRIVR
jgi:hypothetical protein